MEKATSRNPQEELSTFFLPFTSSANNDNLTEGADHQQSNLSSVDISNEIPTGYA